MCMRVPQCAFGSGLFVVIRVFFSRISLYVYVRGARFFLFFWSTVRTYIPVNKKKCVDKYKSTRVWKNIFIQFSLPRINAIKIISMNTLGYVGYILYFRIAYCRKHTLKEHAYAHAYARTHTWTQAHTTDASAQAERLLVFILLFSSSNVLCLCVCVCISRKV